MRSALLPLGLADVIGRSLSESWFESAGVLERPKEIGVILSIVSLRFLSTVSLLARNHAKPRLLLHLDFNFLPLHFVPHIELLLHFPVPSTRAFENQTVFPESAAFCVFYANLLFEIRERFGKFPDCPVEFKEERCREPGLVVGRSCCRDPALYVWPRLC